MTPDEHLAQIRRNRADYDRAEKRMADARDRLLTSITRALDAAAGLPPAEQRALGPSAIARAANFTREYVAKIRAGRGSRPS